MKIKKLSVVITVAVMTLLCYAALQAANSQGQAQSTAVRYRPATEFVRLAPTNLQSASLVWTSALNRVSGFVVDIKSAAGAAPTNTITSTSVGNVVTIATGGVWTNSFVDLLMIE